MAGFEIDTSELTRLSADLGKIPAKAVPEVESVLKKGAQVLKEGMQAEFDASDSFTRKRKGAPLRVTYERRGLLREIAYEIGPEVGAGGMGSLAHIAVDGGANGGGGTVKVDQLLEPEAAVIEKHITDVLGGLL